MKEDSEISLDNPSFWQRVFLQSKVNGAPYHGERLPAHNWNWPEGTYLQRRLQYLRLCRSAEAGDLLDDSLRHDRAAQLKAA